METKKKKNHKFIPAIERFLSPVFFIMLVIILYLGICLFCLDFFYKAKFFPHTYIVNADVSGKSRLEARDMLQAKVDTYNQGLIFIKEGMEKKYLPQDIGININVEKTLARSYEFGREPMSIKAILEKFSLFGSYKNFDIAYTVNQELLQNFIDNEFIPDSTSRNSSLEFKDDKFNFIEGQEGQALNKKYLAAQISRSIKNLSTKKIIAPLDKISSTITEDETAIAKIEARQLLNKKINLKFEERAWAIKEDKIKNWIDFTPKEHERLTTNQYLAADNYDLDKFIAGSLGLNKLNENNHNQILTATLNREAVGKYLQEIATGINIKAQNARFKINNDSLELLKPAEKGRELLIDKNHEGIISAIFANEMEFALITRETGADITENNINDLGIVEIIAVGESDFSNSPQNRRHNIAVASEKLNGILIKPREEYSLVENIGEVNAETGYLPELVIKENKTIPEYGGGLCQIATTNFRAAVNAGLEITERKSHSYAVSYYNPQGTDATVYIPRPDLRFINDTPGNILIQTKIEGNKLYFEFYGTKDGREIELEGPYYWDRRSDGSFKAKWIQIVKINNEIIRRQEFISFYDNPAKYH